MSELFEHVRTFPGLSFSMTFHPWAGDPSSLSLGIIYTSSDSVGDEAVNSNESFRGGGAGSKRKWSCCSIRNSRTSWLSLCCSGDSSWSG